MAKRFDAEVLSSLDEDRTGIIRATIAEHAAALRALGRGYGGGGDLVAYDFGCGSGRYLACLAEHFDRVVGVDISAKLISKAMEFAHERGIHARVELDVEDLAQPSASVRARWPRADFGVCANVLLSPDRAHTTAILEECARRLKPRAPLLVVAPSTEAALYIRQRLVDAKLESELGPKQSVEAVAAGVFRRGGVRTKHHLREELELLARRCGFTMEAIGKVLHWLAWFLVDSFACFLTPSPWHAFPKHTHTHTITRDHEGL